MSFVPIDQEREWTTGDDNIYVYASGRDVVFTGHGTIPTTDYIEATMRMLDQSEDITDDELRGIHEALKDRLLFECDKDLVATPGEIDA